MAGLRDSVCVVTGGGSGIGRAIALRLADEGARVAVLDRNLTGAEDTVAQANGMGAEAIAVEVDTSQAADVERARDKVADRFGDADVLVNNAALLGKHPLDQLPLDEWNRVISVNLTGYFLCARLFGQAMLDRGAGTLVHISSIGSFVATPGAGAYSVSKAGVTMLSNQLALEWGPRGVRSNAVLPGSINTPFVAKTYADPELVRQRAEKVPQRRVGLPEDIARTAVFLASPDSDYVNGAEIVVDGGLRHTLLASVGRKD